LAISQDGTTPLTSALKSTPNWNKVALLLSYNAKIDADAISHIDPGAAKEAFTQGKDSLSTLCLLLGTTLLSDDVRKHASGKLASSAWTIQLKCEAYERETIQHKPEELQHGGAASGGSKKPS